jgi:hypothetical protein
MLHTPNRAFADVATNDSTGAFIKQEKAQSKKKEKKAVVVKEKDKQEEDTNGFCRCVYQTREGSIQKERKESYCG